MQQPTLIIFSPSSTSTPHALQHLVHPDDRDQLAQLRYYRLPPGLSFIEKNEHRQDEDSNEKKEEELNKVLGLMGLARGLMAFSESFSTGSSSTLTSTTTPEQGQRTHTITSSKKQTIIYNPPHTEVFLLLIIRNPLWTEQQAKDVLSGAWDMFTLNFGPDPWVQQPSATPTRAGKWWDEWLLGCMATPASTEEETCRKLPMQQEVRNGYSLQQWLNHTRTPGDMDVEIRHINQQTGTTRNGPTSERIAQGIDSVLKACIPVADVERRHRVIVGSLFRGASTVNDDEYEDEYRQAIIYDTGPSFPPLTDHLLDILLTHSQQRSASNTSTRGTGRKETMKRDRKRSPVRTDQEKEKEKGWPSLNLGLPRFGFGGGTVERGTRTGGGTEGGVMEGSSSGNGAGMAKGAGAGAGGVASWFGFKTDHSLRSTPSTSSPATQAQTPKSTPKAKAVAHIPTGATTTHAEPKIITDMNMESLNEALVTPVEAEFEGGSEGDRHLHVLHDSSTPESFDSLQWTVKRVWLPSVSDEGDDPGPHDPPITSGGGESCGGMDEAMLAYTFHRTSVIALVLASGISEEELSKTLNRPKTPTVGESMDIKMNRHADRDTSNADGLNETVAHLFHTAEHDAVSSTPTQTKQAVSLGRHGATRGEDQQSSSRWLYTSRSAAASFMKSSWKGDEIIFPSGSAVSQRGKPKNPQDQVPGSRGKRVVSVDQAGLVIRRSLIQIDHAEETFARLPNDVWLIGKRQCLPRKQSDIIAKEEEAYLVLTAKETSIVDAEYQLHQVMKAGGGH